MTDEVSNNNTDFSIEERDALNRQNPRFDHYQYYRFGSSIPVRFLIDKDGNQYGAEEIGNQKGTITPDRYYLIRFMDNYANSEFDEIDEHEFRRLVENFVHRISPETKKFARDAMLRRSINERDGFERG